MKMEKVNINLLEETDQIQIVGILKKDIIGSLGICLLCGDIKMYPGAIKHIKQKHKEDFDKYFDKIPEIINSPDYIGVNAAHKESVKLVKIFDKDVLVAVKLDQSGYLYLSSMYSLNPGKVPKRLNSGRLKRVNSK